MPKVSRILITGTPSVGKTTIAREVAKVISYSYINVAKLIIDEQLYKGKDEDRGSIIVDIRKAKKFFSSFLSNTRRVVLDSHVVDIFPKRLISKVIVLRAHPILILKRGLMRGWSLRKSLENAQAELLGVCLFDALHFYGEEKVWQIDCTCRNIDDIILDILEILKGKGKEKRDIDWLTVLEEKN
ncbi:MAG: adenylate kinase family protein, partial [Candidatus Nezhaarchaeales archaeon]